PYWKQAIGTSDLGPFGGNLDYNEIREGMTLYLPVYQAGAMLSMGDGHAQQGDGEITGQGFETSMDVEFTVDLIPNQLLDQPWAPRRRPVRMRATYRRTKGTEQFFGFYDVHADCLDGVFRKRKRLPELFDAFRRLRRCYPRTKLFVVMDNLHQLHDHPRFGLC